MCLILRQAWNPGLFDAVLQCLHLDIPLLDEQNTEKLLGLNITACMCNWDKFWIQKIQSVKKKKPNCYFWGALEQNQGTVLPPAHTTTKGVGKPPKPPFWPDPWSHPHPHQHKEQACPPPPGVSKQGDLWFVLTPSCCSRAPLKPCLDFMSALQSISIDWRRSRTLVCKQFSLIDLLLLPPAQATTQPPRSNSSILC